MFQTFVQLPLRLTLLCHTGVASGPRDSAPAVRRACGIVKAICINRSLWCVVMVCPSDVIY